MRRSIYATRRQLARVVLQRPCPLAINSNDCHKVLDVCGGTCGRHQQQQKSETRPLASAFFNVNTAGGGI